MSAAALKGRKPYRSLITCDHSLLKPFQRRLEKLGIEIKATGNVRTAGWRLFQPSTEQVFPTAFDQDVQRVIDQMEGGVKELHDVYHPGDGGKKGRIEGDGQGPHVRTVALDQSKRCLVCGNAGGLPCPKMVKQGSLKGFAWFKGHSPLDLTHAHVHPGRCRAVLGKFNDTTALPGTAPVRVVGTKKVVEE